VNYNPNLISIAADPVARLARFFHIRDYSDEPPIPGIDRGVELTVIANAKVAYAIWQRGRDILHNEGLWIDSPIVFTLVPRFGEGVPGLRDQKVGGVPDLRTYLYTERGDDGRFNLGRVWPRCGVCGALMAAVGQFDLLPWLLPIHCLTGVEINRYSRAYLLSPVGSGRLCEHAAIFEDYLLHVFACPISSQQFDHPGNDATVLVSDSYRRRDDVSRRSIDPATEADYLASLPDLTPSNDAFVIAPRKIIGWDFRLTFDWDENHDYELIKRDREIVDARPDVFVGSHVDFSLFGTARSQQTPRRYWSVFGYDGAPRRMTPFVAFDDENADMTYQVYVDFARCDGYEIHGKVDASCT
jgi:hypothetical protein